MDYFKAFLNFFDIILIAFLIYLNIKFWNNKYKKIPSYLLLLLFLGIVFPVISFLIEWELNSPPKEDEAFDSFTMLYTLFKFPFYWIICVVQLILLDKPLLRKLFTYQKD